MIEPAAIPAVDELPRLAAPWRARRLAFASLVTAHRPFAEIDAAMADLRAGGGIRTVMRV